MLRVFPSLLHKRTEDNNDVNSNDSSLPLPGAVAVPGQGRAADGRASLESVNNENGNYLSVANGNSASSTTSHINNDDPEEEELHVHAYVVDDAAEREEIERQTISRFLAEVIEADAAVVVKKKWRVCCLLFIVLVVIFMGLAVVGVAVPMSRRRRDDQEEGGQKVEGPSSPLVDEDLLASLRFRKQSSASGAGFLTVLSAELRSTGGGSTVSSGYGAQVDCYVKPCIEDDDACCVDDCENWLFEPGCCLGSNCTKATQCGAICPVPQESCYLTDPNNTTCIRISDCYTCNQVNGQDTYQLEDFIEDIDCLAVGTAIRPENNQEYKWAIACGPVVEGGVEEANYGLGEYSCRAYRTGAGYTHNNGGDVSYTLPCQYISLVECGCAPADVHLFGEDPPSGPCLPGGDCPFLCSDAGAQHARNLCNAFPGGIKWWEGANAFNDTWFYAEGEDDEDDYVLEIYIKGT